MPRACAALLLAVVLLAGSGACAELPSFAEAASAVLKPLSNAAAAALHAAASADPVWVPGEQLTESMSTMKSGIQKLLPNGAVSRGWMCKCRCCHPCGCCRRCGCCIEPMPASAHGHVPATSSSPSPAAHPCLTDVPRVVLRWPQSHLGGGGLCGLLHQDCAYHALSGRGALQNMQRVFYKADQTRAQG